MTHRTRTRVTLTLPTFDLTALNRTTDEIVEGPARPVLDHVSRWLAEGDTVEVHREGEGPNIRGERFAPGYHVQSAAYEQSMRQAPAFAAKPAPRARKGYMHDPVPDSKVGPWNRIRHASLEGGGYALDLRCSECRAAKTESQPLPVSDEWAPARRRSLPWKEAP